MKEEVSLNTREALTSSYKHIEDIKNHLEKAKKMHSEMEVLAKTEGDSRYFSGVVEGLDISIKTLEKYLNS